MAVSNFDYLQTLIAGQDFTHAHQGCGIKLDTNGKAVIATAAAGFVGVLVINNSTGEPVGVQTTQGMKVQVLTAGAIAVGKAVAPTTGGAFTAVTTGDFVGYALEAATAKDQYITIIMMPGTIKAG